mgnify:CR=1 FL=1
MGSVGAMARGSADRYFQQEVEGHARSWCRKASRARCPTRARSTACCTSWSAACAPAWAMSARPTSRRSGARPLRAGVARRRVTESHTHGVGITREAPELSAQRLSHAAVRRDAGATGPDDRVNQVAILYPVFVQVLLVVARAACRWRWRARAPSRPWTASAATPTWPWAASPGRTMRPSAPPTIRNQFELPVLFYAVVAFALITKGADTAHDRAGLAVRADAHRACRHPHRPQQGAVAHAGLRAGLPDRGHHVDQACRCTWPRPGWPEPHAAGRAHQGRHRGARGGPEPAPPGGDARWPTGARAIASPARATARPSATWSTTRCAAAGRWPRRWTTTPPRDRLGRRPARAGAVAGRRHRQRRRLAACGGAAERGRAGSAWRARCLPMRRRRCAATSRTGWSHRSPRAFGAAAAEEGAALARRAPVDLRVNTLKADRDKVLKALARFAPSRRRCRRSACRLPAPDGPGRQPNVEAEIGHGRGWYEVQDEGSQIAALMAAAGPAPAGARYLCRRRRQDAGLRRGHAQHRPDLRLRRRCGAAAADLRAPQAGRRAQCPGAPARRRGRADRRSGPDSTWCSSTPPAPAAGAWRRRPDAKWRLKPANLAQRQQGEQRAILDAGGADGQTRRPARLRHLLGAAGGERRPDRLVPGEPFGLRDVALA